MLSNRQVAHMIPDYVGQWGEVTPEVLVKRSIKSFSSRREQPLPHPPPQPRHEIATVKCVRLLIHSTSTTGSIHAGVTPVSGHVHTVSAIDCLHALETPATFRQLFVLKKTGAKS